MKQHELIELLEKNPHKIKVFFLEVGIVKGSNFIFVDKIGDTLLYADGKPKITYTETIISVYSTSNKILQETLRFIKSNFNGSVVYSREEKYYKATITAKLVIDEWQ